MNNLSVILGECLGVALAIVIIALVMAIYYIIYSPCILVVSVLINGSFTLGWQSFLGQSKRTKNWFVQGWFV